MIVVECVQGTPEWYAARLGIPTASCFDKILTPTGKASSQAEGYANLLLAERITGKPQGWEGNAWTERGKELEGEARDYYAFARDLDVREVGFCLRDDRRVGCSPDGLIGEDGLLEIKCPSPQVHIEYLLDGAVPTKYLSQVQGQLYVTGRKWVDFLSYHPDMPPVLCRIVADPGYHKLLGVALTVFLQALEDKAERLKGRLA